MIIRRIVTSLGALLIFAYSGGCTHYYVSPDGDNGGNGSERSPWKTIQHAISRVSHPRTGPPIVHIKEGTYEENINVTEPIVLKGVGDPDKIIIRSPGEEPGVEDAANKHCWPEGMRDPVVNIRGPRRPPDGPGKAGIFVQLEGITIDGAEEGPAIRAQRALLSIKRTNIVNQAVMGISIEDCPYFEIRGTTMLSGDPKYSDLGVCILRSEGLISGLRAGGFIDHIINILWSDVTIKNSRLQGSPISYADGIRIQAPSTVEIVKTTIIRPKDSEPGRRGETGHLLDNGIEIAMGGSPEQLRTVRIEGCTINGFDVGIGVNVNNHSVSAEGNNIFGKTHAVETLWTEEDQKHPLVDFGGGDLGSNGKNKFGVNAAEGCVFLHGGPYDVTALNNDWGVDNVEDIADRICDKKDDPSRGEVSY